MGRVWSVCSHPSSNRKPNTTLVIAPREHKRGRNSERDNKNGGNSIVARPIFILHSRPRYHTSISKIYNTTFALTDKCTETANSMATPPSPAAVSCLLRLLKPGMLPSLRPRCGYGTSQFPSFICL